MNSRKTLIELYSNMPSNQFEDCKMAGEFIMVKPELGIKIIDQLIQDCVEFAVYEVGDCVIDRSYKYWEDHKEEHDVGS